MEATWQELIKTAIISTGTTLVILFANWLGGKAKAKAETRKANSESKKAEAEADKTTSDIWETLYNKMEERSNKMEARMEEFEKERDSCKESMRILENTVSELKILLDAEKEARKKLEDTLARVVSWAKRNHKKLIEAQIEPIPLELKEEEK